MNWLLMLALLFGQRPPDPAALYQDGLAALRAQNWTLASDKLLARQQAAPDAMTYYLLAVAFSHQNRFEDTENAARRALQASPKLPDQFRTPAARLMGWAQGMKTSGRVSVQYTMGNRPNRRGKDLEAIPAQALPEQDQIEEERKSTLQYLQQTDPCADRNGMELTGCRQAHARDTLRMPATRLP